MSENTNETTTAYVPTLWWESADCTEALRRWDAGESIWSVEMGGLGPGYEQAIQVLIVELIRDNLGKPLPEPDAAINWGDDTVHRLNATCGFSGAQVGAARSVAYRMLRDGYSATLDSMRKHDDDRLIQVSNNWPRAGEPRPND